MLVETFPSIWMGRKVFEIHQYHDISWISISSEHIVIVFPPANTTSLIQFVDQGFIWTLKEYYRKEISHRIIAIFDEIVERERERERDLDEKTAIKFAKTTFHSHLFLRTILAKSDWNNINSKFFRKDGFVQGVSMNSHLQDDDADHLQSDDTSAEEFEQWMTMDEDIYRRQLPQVKVILFMNFQQWR